MKNKVLTSTKMAIAVVAILGAATGCSPSNPTTPTVDPTTVPTVEPTIEPTVERNYWCETYSNPIIPRGSSGQKYMTEAPDPSIVRGDDGYLYAVTTGNGGGKMFRSPDGCSWKVHLERVINRPTWGDYNGGDTPNVWAPDLIKIQDKWIYCYSLSGWGNAIGIGYAVADQVEGPYEDMGKLVTC
jgi:beta-xylosidase